MTHPVFIYQKMAKEALALDLIERVEKFSFATLYTGELKSYATFNRLNDLDRISRICASTSRDPMLN